MPIETEVKIEIDRQKKFEEIYQAIGSPNWSVQRNYIFCFGKSILRLRHEGLTGKACLTVKGEDQGQDFNERPEFECEIPEALFIGFVKIRGTKKEPIYYEKSRASARFMDCQVCLDRFFGIEYFEIEGTQERIRRIVSKFELKDFPVERRSYTQLLVEMEAMRHQCEIK